MVFPSRFEGFGAPVLEAMGRGVPGHRCGRHRTPEVVSDAGRLVSPDNAEEWAQAMADFIENETMRDGFVKAGLDRAKTSTGTSRPGILEDAYRHALETPL